MADFISIAYAITVTAGGLLGYVRAGWFISYIIISLKIKINVLTSWSVLLCHFRFTPFKTLTWNFKVQAQLIPPVHSTTKSKWSWLGRRNRLPISISMGSNVDLPWFHFVLDHFSMAHIVSLSVWVNFHLPIFFYSSSKCVTFLYIKVAGTVLFSWSEFGISHSTCFRFFIPLSDILQSTTCNFFAVAHFYCLVFVCCEHRHSKQIYIRDLWLWASDSYFSVFRNFEFCGSRGKIRWKNGWAILENVWGIEMCIGKIQDLKTQ